MRNRDYIKKNQFYQVILKSIKLTQVTKTQTSNRNIKVLYFDPRKKLIYKFILLTSKNI